MTPDILWSFLMLNIKSEFQNYNYNIFLQNLIEQNSPKIETLQYSTTT